MKTFLQSLRSRASDVCLRLMTLVNFRMRVKSLDIFPRTYDKAQLAISEKSLRGLFPDKMPIGIVVHHTADRDLARSRRALEQNGLGYHVIISRDGSMTQLGYFDQKMWHAGKAVWNGHSPNSRFIAVSLLSWGELKFDHGKFKTWTDVEIPQAETAHRPANIAKGFFYWDAATNEQFSSLLDFCVWACDAGIRPEFICGHDECAIPAGRKSDPGGVLPVTMEDFRKLVKSKMRPLSS